MPERSQITYMQARLARLAAQKWNVSIADVGRLFGEYQVFQHIRDHFDYYHLEGDEAIWEDLQPFFLHKGCPYV